MAVSPLPPTSTVLLVDDDPVALSLLSALVTGMEGTDVITFRDPLEAMAWCKLHPADLVITDQQMPGLSGTELIRGLRADLRYRDVPLLMITTVQDRDVRREAVLLGANDYLSKPLDPVEVGARIRNMLALRRSTQSLARYAASLEEEVRKATVEITTREHEAIVRLARATEYRDWETGAHIVRVAWYARIMARNSASSRASRMPSSVRPRCTTWEDRGARLHPAQAERARRHRIRNHETAHRHRTPDSGRERLDGAAARLRGGADPPRAAGRVRVSGRTGGDRHSARGRIVAWPTASTR
jgi:DNA-binding response OmpR family regulator